jgi:hypothetical protein
MGWNSWDCFGVDVTEEEVKANAALMAERLRPVGWEYIVVDLAWYGDGLTARGEQYKMERPPQLIDRWGRLIPNISLHPSAADGTGFKPLADHLHSLGLKFGIHIMRGVPWQAVEAKSPIKGTSYTCDEIALDKERCHWYKGMYSIDMTHPGGQAYYDSLGELYASWDVDFVKADDMNSWTDEETSPYRVDEVEGISRALQRSGRPMVLSLSPGGARLAQAAHLQRHAHMWRISPDFWDNWKALKKMFRRCARWSRFTGPQSWPDADMLPMGRLALRAERGDPRETNFTEDEQYTMMTLWCLARSPLMFGGHLPETGDFAWSLISNPEAMAVNQFSSGGREINRGRGTVMWTARPEKGAGLYLGVFNTGETGPKAIKVQLPELGFNDEVQVRDLWAQKDLGFATRRFEIDVNAHGARLLLLKTAETV